MQLSVELTGGGGEPVDLLRTIRSHGCVRLAPNRVLAGGTQLELPLRLRDGRSALIGIGPGPDGTARIAVRGALRGAAVEADVRRSVRRMLHLDADYSAFYARAADDPALAWVTRGAGRFLRSATAFEDVIKTVCTTNCAWSATVRMTDALVTELGEPVWGPSGARLFPTPAAMAKAPEAWYRDVARAGYRGAYMRAIAAAVTSGNLDLEALADSSPDDLPDDAFEQRLRELPGVGPYAAAHIMMLLGRFSRPVFDSWTRPAYARLSGKRPRSDAPIVRRFKPYGRFAGLAFWCYVTSDWLDEPSADTIAATTPASVSSSRA